ncbi:MAG: MFS transporter [Burkholderiaceae bacterium]|nr:MFS transporter [Burkholderiaceae bacterium]MEB2353234.1 MFS transporter [Burkholderiaceae bacterium]
MIAHSRGVAALLAATVSNLPFGTLYAFSVFLAPMEALIGAPRAQMSFVFGLATVTLTLGMNVAPRLYHRFSPGSLAVACGLSSAAGLWLAAQASSIVQFALGYGLLFGPGAGVVFILGQQAVNQTVGEARRGLANGYVVSLYPLGAMLGAPIFGWSIQAFGVRATLAGLGLAVVLGCTIAAALVRAAAIRMRDADAADDGGRRLGPTFYLLAGVFFLAAAAGLTVLSQAAAIVQAYGGAAALAVGATTFITGAVGAARVTGGWLVDHFSAARVGIGAHACSLAGALMLAVVPTPATAVFALALIGMGYGIVSGLIAGAIAQYWHRNAFGFVASRLYIAWCMAAISLPVLAGALFDHSGSYAGVVWMAAGINALGMLIARRLPART